MLRARSVRQGPKPPSPWFGLLAPAGTPEPVVRKINGELAELLRDKDAMEKFAALGADRPRW